VLPTVDFLPSTDATVPRVGSPVSEHVTPGGGYRFVDSVTRAGPLNTSYLGESKLASPSGLPLWVGLSLAGFLLLGK